MLGRHLQEKLGLVALWLRKHDVDIKVIVVYTRFCI